MNLGSGRWQEGLSGLSGRVEGTGSWSVWVLESSRSLLPVELKNPTVGFSVKSFVGSGSMAPESLVTKLPKVLFDVLAS